MREKYTWRRKIHKEGTLNKGVLSAATSVSIIAGIAKVLALKRLNQYPYKLLST